ncbi:MAG: Zn-ribbon-containing protein [Armatimonadota bacterium]
MHIAEVALSSETGEEGLEALGNLLGAYRLNGQALGREFPLYERDGAYRAVVLVPARDSLEPRYANRWVADWLADISRISHHAPVISILGEAPDARDPCACEERTSLILYTTYVSLESCLRCGDCFDPVPLYTIPATADAEYHDILSWQSDYQACDQLQMNCRTGERFGLRELSRLDSSLSRRGLEICRKIEAGTGLPTFYYLLRYYGVSARRERERPCPGCGQPWRLDEPLHRLFDFRCEPCRLLSNLASMVR